jgi:signal peptidase I
MLLLVEVTHPRMTQQGRVPKRGKGPLAAAAVVAVVLLVRFFVVSPMQVTSDSMEPTVSIGDTVVVDKVGWRFTDVQRGDLVTFTSPDDGTHVVKRVVGLAGDRITIEDAVLKVNGAIVPEPYVDHSRIDALYFGPVVVPAAHAFVLGDNRFGSIDSRVYGPVPMESIDGRVVLVLG